MWLLLLLWAAFLFCAVGTFFDFSFIIIAAIAALLIYIYSAAYMTAAKEHGIKNDLPVANFFIWLLSPLTLPVILIAFHYRDKEQPERWNEVVSEILTAAAYLCAFYFLFYYGGCSSANAPNKIEQSRRLITGENTAQETAETKSTYVKSRLDSFAGFNFGDEFNPKHLFQYKYKYTVGELFYDNSHNARMCIDCANEIYSLYDPKVELPGIDQQYLLTTELSHKIFGIILRANDSGEADRRFAEWRHLLERKYGAAEINQYPSQVDFEVVYEFANGKIFLQKRSFGGVFMVAVNTDLYELAKKEYREKLNNMDISEL